MAAGGAVVVAEMADVGGGELVGPSAADAVARVGRVLQRRAGVRGIVDAEGDRAGAVAAEVADLRIVAVDHEHRLRRQLGGRRPPVVGDVLELAVAVELVAEEVAEQHGARPDAAHDLGQRALVHLEQAELRVALRQERGGDAGGEVRARAVPGEATSRLEDLGGHRSRRRLPVRRGDDRGAVRQPRGERVDRARIELPEQLARQRRAAARARQARELAGGAGGEGFDGKAGAHRRRAYRLVTRSSELRRP